MYKDDNWKWLNGCRLHKEELPISVLCRNTGKFSGHKSWMDEKKTRFC